MGPECWLCTILKKKQSRKSAGKSRKSAGKSRKFPALNLGPPESKNCICASSSCLYVSQPFGTWRIPKGYAPRFGLQHIFHRYFGGGGSPSKKGRGDGYARFPWCHLGRGVVQAGGQCLWTKAGLEWGPTVSRQIKLKVCCFKTSFPHGLHVSWDPFAISGDQASTGTRFSSSSCYPCPSPGNNDSNTWCGNCSCWSSPFEKYAFYLLKLGWG